MLPWHARGNDYADREAAKAAIEHAVPSHAAKPSLDTLEKLKLVQRQPVAVVTTIEHRRKPHKAKPIPMTPKEVLVSRACRLAKHTLVESTDSRCACLGCLALV